VMQVGKFKYGTVTYGGVEYAKEIVRGRSVLYQLVDGKIKKGTKYVYEHRLVYELYSGEKLKKGDVVHHVNGDKTDNRFYNLRKMSLQEHSRQHTIEDAEKKGYRIGPYFCIDCGAEVTHKAKRCLECSRKLRMVDNHPTKEVLEDMIKKMTNSEIAKVLHVSDASVRKWRMSYGLLSAREQRKSARV